MCAPGKKLRQQDGGGVSFRCPGCNDFHTVYVGEGPGPRWGFNGDVARPTFTPSVLVRTGHHVTSHKHGDSCWCTYNAEHPEETVSFTCQVCHSFVTDGQIQFLSDCTHALAGQTVPLPDWEGEGR